MYLTQNYCTEVMGNHNEYNAKMQNLEGISLKPVLPSDYHELVQLSIPWLSK